MLSSYKRCRDGVLAGAVRHRRATNLGYGATKKTAVHLGSSS